MTAAWFALALVSGVIELPFSGAPLEPSRLELVSRIPGVARAETGAGALRIELAQGAELRLSTLRKALGTRETAIDRRRLPLGPHTIFEMDAGQCFFCAERPLGKRLSRRPVVRRWTVVDYAARGRLRFRIEPRTADATLGALGRLPVEDILFTTRYEGVERVELYWPSGGIRWRESEKAARREASDSAKPLLIFPTAGT